MHCHSGPNIELLKFMETYISWAISGHIDSSAVESISLVGMDDNLLTSRKSCLVQPHKIFVLRNDSISPSWLDSAGAELGRGRTPTFAQRSISSQSNNA